MRQLFRYEAAHSGANEAQTASNVATLQNILLSPFVIAIHLSDQNFEHAHSVAQSMILTNFHGF